MKKRLFPLLTTSFFVTVLFPVLVAAAPVKSISLEVFKDAATPFWEVSVSCESVPAPRTMTKSLEGEQWCSSELDALCDENKFSLSRQLCGDSFAQQVLDYKNGKGFVKSAVQEAPSAESSAKALQAKPKVAAPKKTGETVAAKPNKLSSSPLASRDNLLKEQMQIEEQRILIQQKRLELRRRELALQKRRLNAS